SRRRHTRSKRDWSSDVCSSDLNPPPLKRSDAGASVRFRFFFAPRFSVPGCFSGEGGSSRLTGMSTGGELKPRKLSVRVGWLLPRSEERRVGKECRGRW